RGAPKMSAIDQLTGLKTDTSRVHVVTDFTPTVLVVVETRTRRGAQAVIDTGIPVDAIGHRRFSGESIPGAGYRGSSLIRRRLRLGDIEVLDLVMTGTGRVKAANVLPQVAANSKIHWFDDENSARDWLIDWYDAHGLRDLGAA